MAARRWAGTDCIGVATWFGWDLDWNRVVFDADPPSTVRRCSGHPGWLPFATRCDGNFFAVDLAPAVGGRVGRVIEVGRGFDGGPRCVVSSVAAWLGRVLGRPDPHAWQRSGERRRQLVASALDRQQLASGVQAVHLDDAPSLVGLASLAAAACLCRLRLNRCAAADLTPVAALPVEDLVVDLAADAGLTSLTGHPHLASLAVGATTPIDLAPLRTLPARCALDLSGCPTVDVALLADLPGMRYLALSPAQWTALDAAGRIPARLAGAPLAGALDLLAVLGTDTCGAYRLSGTVDGDSWPPGHGEAAGEAGGRSGAAAVVEKVVSGHRGGARPGSMRVVGGCSAGCSGTPWLPVRMVREPPGWVGGVHSSRVVVRVVVWVVAVGVVKASARMRRMWRSSTPASRAARILAAMSPGRRPPGRVAQVPVSSPAAVSSPVMGAPGRPGMPVRAGWWPPLGRPGAGAPCSGTGGGLRPKTGRPLPPRQVQGPARGWAQRCVRSAEGVGVRLESSSSPPCPTLRGRPIRGLPGRGSSGLLRRAVEVSAVAGT